MKSISSVNLSLGIVSVPLALLAAYGCSSSSSPSQTPDASTEDGGLPGTSDSGTTPDSSVITTPDAGDSGGMVVHDAGPDATDSGADSGDASDSGAVVLSQKVTQTNLFADMADGGAAHVDPNLVNAWGLAFNPSGTAWISDNGTGLATLYQTGLPTPVGLVVQVPLPGGGFPDGGSTPAAPSGQIFNAAAAAPDAGTTGDFKGDLFIISTEDGTISGWASSLADKTKATLRVDDSSAGAVFKGLAIVASSPPVLVAADFHNGKLLAFDTNYNPITPAAGKWTDPSIPTGFAPFNIVSAGTNVYVAYAKQDAKAHDDMGGPGNGAVSVFQTDGTLVKSLIPTGGHLNSPWGLAVVPAGGWGSIPAGDLLVGDFGDGKIQAFDATSGALTGTLVSASAQPISIDGLWSIVWGPNAPDAGTTPAQLYFTAGPNGEANGLYGYLTAP